MLIGAARDRVRILFIALIRCVLFVAKKKRCGANWVARHEVSTRVRHIVKGVIVGEMLVWRQSVSTYHDTIALC